MSLQGTLPSHPDIMQLIDWRFTQIQQGLFVHLNSIKNTMDEKFKTLDENITHFLDEINKLKECVVRNKDEIQKLQEDKQTILDRLENIEKKQESTEQDMKFCNVKLINVEELEWEDDHTTMEYIIHVLNSHTPLPKWRHEDISRAYRIGKPGPWRSEPRPIIVHFHRWSDKMALLGDKVLRDSLRESNIRVSSDLTLQQRKNVDFYRGQGKIAYIHHGRLHVRDRQPSHLFRDGRNPHYRSARSQHEEDWPSVSDSRHDGYNRRSEPRHSKQQPSWKNYVRHDRYQRNRYHPHPSQEYWDDEFSARPYDREQVPALYQHTKYQHPHRAPGRNRELSTNGLYKTRYEDGYRNVSGALPHARPVVPGTRSYSEVTRQNEQAESAQRTVFLKGSSSKTASITPENNGKKSRHNRRCQENTKQAEHFYLENEGNFDRKSQPSQSLTEGRKRSSEDPSEDSGDITSKDLDDRTLRVDKDHQDMSDDVLTADIDFTPELEVLRKDSDVETVVDISGPDKTDKTDSKAEHTDENVIKFSTDRHDELTQTTNTNCCTDTQVLSQAISSPEQDAEQDRQSLSTVQCQRPRRAASQTSSTRQSSRKVPARSGSQTSIADCFKKIQSGDSVNNKDSTPKAKSNIKTNGTTDSGTTK